MVAPAFVCSGWFCADLTKRSVFAGGFGCIFGFYDGEFCLIFPYDGGIISVKLISLRLRSGSKDPLLSFLSGGFYGSE